MKALSLIQPWASLLIEGTKRIETRSWSSRHRGPVAIHASLRLTQDSHDLAAELAGRGIAVDLQTRGVVLGSATLVDVFEIKPHWLSAAGIHSIRSAEQLQPVRRWELTDLEFLLGNFEPGRFAWLFADPIRYAEPIPAAGSLSLWEWTGA